MRLTGKATSLAAMKANLHSLSFAKNVAAAFKMSRSIVRRLLSRRSLANSYQLGLIRQRPSASSAAA